MPWGRLDDKANDSPKLRLLSDAAFRMWACGLIYCQAHLTDGFIPEGMVYEFGVKARNLGAVADELCSIKVPGKGPLWHREQGGYRVHDYHDWNDSRAQVEAARQSSLQRMALFRDRNLREQVRSRDGDRCRYCGRLVRWADKKGDLGGTYDHVNPSGGNAVGNLVVCCRGCNSRKRNRTPDEAGMALRPCGDPPSDSSQTVNQIQNRFKSGFEFEVGTNNCPRTTYHGTEEQERAPSAPIPPVEAVENRIVRFQRRARSRETSSGKPSIRVITALARDLLKTDPTIVDEGELLDRLKCACASSNLLYDSTACASAIDRARAQLRHRKDVPA